MKTPFAITTGDVDGIGLEITTKALEAAPSGDRYLVYASEYKSSAWQKKLLKLKNVELLIRTDAPAQWVKEAAELCLKKQYRALITGPMSKNPTGHTEILQKVSQSRRVQMCFLGTRFHVILATGHIPISKVSNSIDESLICDSLDFALKLRSRLKLKKPVGILGLNPHSGENGNIGKEDLNIRSWIKKFKNVEGPLVPDVAFQKFNYSVYVALYHDQGLIPFKALHTFSEGTHLTLGIPFLRTSVDHGTAKDIFNTGKADPGSMISALAWARTLS